MIACSLTPCELNALRALIAQTVPGDADDVARRAGFPVRRVARALCKLRNRGLAQQGSPLAPRAEWEPTEAGRQALAAAEAR